MKLLYSFILERQNIIPEYGFSLTHIFPLYGRIRVRENPYSGIFYAVSSK